MHYIADELWEGLNNQLGAGQGFVRTLASFNLGRPGVTDDAESIANMAADFAVSWSMDESAIAPWRRDFPVDDIVAIYHAAGFPNVTRASIADCRLLFDLGLWAEKSFGWLLFHMYAEELQHVPMAAEGASRTSSSAASTTWRCGRPTRGSASRGGWTTGRPPTRRRAAALRPPPRRTPTPTRGCRRSSTGCGRGRATRPS